MEQMEEREVGIIHMHRCVVQQCLAFKDAKLRNTRLNTTTTPTPTQWKRPPPGWYKLNFDGSSKGNTSKTSSGGIIRDATGQVVKGFVLQKTSDSAFLSEVMACACQGGLNLARDLGVEKLIVEADCSEIIHILRDRNIQAHRCYNVIQSCWNLIDSSTWEVNFQTSSRICNMLANTIAKYGHSVTGAQFVFNSLPVAFADVLANDLRLMPL